VRGQLAKHAMEVLLPRWLQAAKKMVVAANLKYAHSFALCHLSCGDVSATDAKVLNAEPEVP